MKRGARASARQRGLPKTKEVSAARFRRERDEALEQQAATAEVLRVISASPDDLEPVFDAILENATRLCHARFGTLNLYDGEAYTVSLCIIRRLNSSREKGRLFVRIRKADSPMSPVPKRLRTSTIRTRRPYLEGDKAVVGLADLGGARTLLIVPLLKQSKLIGTISIYRQEVRPFTDRQIEVVKNLRHKQSSPSRTRGC